MDEALIELHLHLTQSELTSLLMAQITQARLSRLSFGELAAVTCTDRAVLEKLVAAQRRTSPQVAAAQAG